MENFVDINSFKKWKVFAEKQDFRCVYCGLDLLASPENYASSQRDHLRPQSKKGKGVVLACYFCNMVKRNADYGNAEECEDITEEAREGIIKKAREDIKIRREAYLKKYEYEELKRMYRTVKASELPLG